MNLNNPAVPEAVRKSVVATWDFGEGINLSDAIRVRRYTAGELAEIHGESGGNAELAEFAASMPAATPLYWVDAEDDSYATDCPCAAVYAEDGAEVWENN